jgi:glycerol-3-phosphate dehydrogenase
LTGVVGLSVARELAVRGEKVVLLEKSAELASAASGGNSGLGCTGYDAPRGSLEQHLLRRSIRRHPPLYRSFGLSYDHVNKCGSLVVAWTPEELNALQGILAENLQVGDTEAELLSREELLELEPSLAPNCLGALSTPREMIAEPWLVPMGYAESARLHGAALVTSVEVTAAEVIEAKGSTPKHWLLRTRSNYSTYVRIW